MIKTIGLKTEYTPVKKINDHLYKISWDYTDVKEPIYQELTEEQIEKRKNGEVVDLVKIGEEDTEYCEYVYEYIYHKPSINEIKNLIIKWYNDNIDNKILSGFIWNDMPIWLSSENQFNYKAAYDLAVQTAGSTLPVTFKFGTSSYPVYYTFFNMEDFNQFYTQTISYINNTLTEGWQKKDSINWELYKISE